MSLTSDPLPASEGDKAFDPFAYLEEVPHDTLAELRSECPVARTPTGWYLTKFDHVLAATKDVDTFVSSFRDPGVVIPEEERQPRPPGGPGGTGGVLGPGGSR